MIQLAATAFLPIADVKTQLPHSARERLAQHGLSSYKKWVDVAAILNFPGVRMHLPNGEKGDEITCTASALQELAQHGSAANIVIDLENDEPEREAPQRIAKVIQAVSSPFL